MVEPRIAERTISIDGGELHYLEAGSGPPLVLLHGFGHSSTSWLRTMPSFARQYRTIALDLPDYRREATWAVSFEPAAFAATVLRFADALELEPAHIIGHSFGGVVAMLAALARPESFRSLVLVDSLGFTTPPAPPLDDALLALLGFWLALPRRPIGLIRAGYAMSFYDASRLDEETVLEIVRHAATPLGMRSRSRTLHEIFHFSRRLGEFHQQLAALRLPILIVWGKNDPVLWAKDAETARRVLPGARLEVIERCGHNPQIELPTVFSSIVLDFLGTT